MVSRVIAGCWNNAEIKALSADVNIGAIQTTIADVPRTFTARITPVSSVQNARIASLALLYLLQCHNSFRLKTCGHQLFLVACQMAWNSLQDPTITADCFNPRSFFHFPTDTTNFNDKKRIKTK